MINQFDPTIPAPNSRLQSKPVRDNLNALNDRSNQLTVSATNPVSTSINVGPGDKVYFEDNTFVPFPGGTINLGDLSTGVSAFNTPGTFKEIIVYYANVGLSGALGFIESVEQFTRVRNTSTLINTPTSQIDPSTGHANPGPANLLDGTIPICSILVTNSGTAGQRGQIVQIGDGDILDIRPYMQRGGDIKALIAHINAPSLALAHPEAIVGNTILEIKDSTIAIASNPGDKNLYVQAVAGRFAIGEYVRIPTTPIADPQNPPDGTLYYTAQVIGVNQSSNYITIDRTNLPAFAVGTPVIRGVITLDRMAFDVAASLAEVTQGFLTITSDLSGNSIYSLGPNTVYNVNVAPTAAIQGTKIVPSFGSQAVSTTGSGSFGSLTVSGIITAGSAPTTLTDATGKILSAALNIVQPQQGGTGVNNTGTLTYGSNNITINTTATTSVTFPTSGTLVTLAGNEVLTNKTLSGNTSTNFINGSGTLDINSSGTITIPNATDTLVGRNTGDVLTNKTIDGYSNTITNISLTTAVTGTLPIGNGGTGQTSALAAFNALSPLSVEGDLLYYHSGSNARLAIGSVGTVLVTNGTDPLWLQITDGYISSSAAISRSKIAAGTDGYVVYNDATTGLLTSEANLAVSRGGTGVGTLPDHTGGSIAGTVVKTNGSSPVQTTDYASSAVVNTLVYRDNSTTGGTINNGQFQVGKVRADIFEGNLTGTNAFVAGTSASTVGNAIGTMTSSNTPNTLVERDISGNFSAGLITATLDGYAYTAGSVTGVVPIVNGGTGATTSSGARLNLGAAASGANSDITSLTGLTTPLAITEGGTGQTSALAAFNALSPLNAEGDLLYYHSGNNSKLPIGSSGTVLVTNGTDPQWFQITDGYISSSAAISRSKIAAGPVAQVVYNDNSTGLLTSELHLAVPRGGTGVGSLTDNTGVGIDGTVVKTNGVNPVQFTDYATAATVDTLVYRDGYGNFSANLITANLSGNATNVTGTVAIANGGTGATTDVNALTNLRIYRGFSDFSVSNSVTISLPDVTQIASNYSIVATYTDQTGAPFADINGDGYIVDDHTLWISPSPSNNTFTVNTASQLHSPAGWTFNWIAIKM